MPTNWKRIQDFSQSSKSENNQYSNFESAQQINENPQQAPQITSLETFIPETPNRKLNEVVLPEIVRSRIETALNRIKHHSKLYDEWNLKAIDPHGRRVAINFFGPPGTGKTFSAEAIAHHLGKQIIKINYAEIESKYVGETPKNITAAFKRARETDAILFFDEADSILGKRLTNVTQSADHSVNVSRSVMLLQLDEFDGIVVFASNLPENYDGAFARRILAHIEFELPDEECRVRLWNYLIPKELPRADSVTAHWLAAQSEGLSGGDILNVVKLAASQAVVREGEHCKVHQTDILDGIAQVRLGKTKVGISKANPSQMTIKERVLQPSELSPEEQLHIDEVVAEFVPNSSSTSSQSQ